MKVRSLSQDKEMQVVFVQMDERVLVCGFIMAGRYETPKKPPSLRNGDELVPVSSVVCRLTIRPWQRG